MWLSDVKNYTGIRSNQDSLLSYIVLQSSSLYSVGNYELKEFLVCSGKLVLGAAAAGYGFYE